MPPKYSDVDLLIIGAGPAGLMAAACASQCNVNARIIDEKDGRVRTGQADGLHCRTLEIMDSLGSPSIADEILAQACVIKEISSWNPIQGDEDHIERSESVRSGEEDLPGSRYPQVSLSQGSVEQAFLNFFERDGHSIRVERNLTPKKLVVDDSKVEDHDAYPIEVHLRELGKDGKASSPNATEEPVKEIVRAKYVLGTDGAHSWTRKALGLKMEGDRTNKHFGVMDFIPLSNFPDIRISSAIHSSSGSIMTLPREKGLVRFYVQLGDTTSKNNSFDASKVTPDDIMTTSRKILRPYTLDYGHCDWFSVYTVGQRLAESFSHHDRVFLAGDAVHTHSPTMGAGMNVSMQDSYNLIWKIATALRTKNRDILSTYNTERMATANELIQKDRAMSEFYCQGPSANSKRYQEFREGFRDFVSGVAVEYAPSILISASANHSNETSKRNDSPQPHAIHSKPEFAATLRLGQRLPSYTITNHFTAEPIHLQTLLKSTIHWRILVFAGSLTSPSPSLHLLTDTLTSLANHPLYSSFVEIIIIHTSPRISFNALELPDIFHPWDDEKGYDYYKLFCRDNERGDDVYGAFGVEEEKGAVVLVRPDMHVAWIGGVEDSEMLKEFLRGVFGMGEGMGEGM